MKITFGWGFDGARWTEGSALGTVVTGPVGLADLLATRLGCGAGDTQDEQPVCVAAYRAALADLRQTSPEALVRWYGDSFDTDPWRVARELLAWRDELVSAGWSVGATAEAPAGSAVERAMPEAPLGRLATLVAVETRLQESGRFPPSHADQVRAVRDALEQLRATGTPWPLGIERIEVDGRVCDLPQIWRRILTDVVELGVEVEELPQPARLDSLQIFSADTDWDAAATAARVLAGWASQGRRHTVLVGGPSDVLDLELARRGLPAVGCRERTADRPLGQIIPMFLTACTAPQNVGAIVGLITSPIGTIARPEDGSSPQKVRLFPAGLVRAVLKAFAQEPGVGGEQWSKAIGSFYAEPPSADDSDRYAALADDLDRLVNREPITIDAGYSVVVAKVVAHLDWLRERLTAVNRACHSWQVSAAVQQVGLVSRLLCDLGDVVTVRELGAIIDDCVEVEGFGAGATADGFRDVAAAPGSLGTGTAPLLWWMPTDDEALPRVRCRREELQWLASAGVEVPDQQEIASLTLNCQIRAVRRRRHVVAVLPASVDGKARQSHPAITFLLADVRAAASVNRSSQDEPETIEDTMRRVSRTPDRLISETAAGSAVWSLSGPGSSALARLHLCDWRRPDPFEWQVVPGEQLFPSKLSYSSWSKLLIHPMEWLLERELGVRTGRILDVSTGNQMIGTWMHRAVQQIVGDALQRSAGEPARIRVSRDEARAVLGGLIPAYASELALPGRERSREALLDTGARSIAELFSLLDDASIRASGTEVPFDDAVSIPLPGWQASMSLSGRRDLDVVMPDGRRGVVDLKYTRSTKRYRELVEQGQALQLAVYALSVAQEESQMPGVIAESVSDVPVGYWLFGQRELVTAFSQFGVESVLDVQPAETGARDTHVLIQRATVGLIQFLERLRDGRIIDVGNMIATPHVWSSLRKALLSRAVEIPADGLSAQQVTAARQAWADAFLPVGVAEYIDMGLLTGMQEESL